MKWLIIACVLFINTNDAMQLSIIPSSRENILSSSPKKLLHTILQKNGSYKNVKQSAVQKISFHDDQQLENPSNATEVELKQRRKLISHLSRKINKMSKNMAKQGSPEIKESGTYENAEYSLWFINRNGALQCFVNCPALSGL